MKVGGRDFSVTKREVESLMRRQTPELIQKYVVEVNGVAFPPKQVLGYVTGWPRTSYTTMEAQRVLAKLGFVCREARAQSTAHAGGTGGHHENPGATRLGDRGDRIAALEAAVATAQEAIAGLATRVRALEGTG